MVSPIFIDPSSPTFNYTIGSKTDESLKELIVQINLGPTVQKSGPKVKKIETKCLRNQKSRVLQTFGLYFLDIWLYFLDEPTVKKSRTKVQKYREQRNQKSRVLQTFGPKTFGPYILDIWSRFFGRLLQDTVGKFALNISEISSANNVLCKSHVTLEMHRMFGMFGQNLTFGFGHIMLIIMIIKHDCFKAPGACIREYMFFQHSIECQTYVSSLTRLVSSLPNKV
ncbi:hypothetical protein HELRODRAFT_167018 [Helobdella robusta]|uniref:Uncharacterized protein n=1 Tax=Helobdella robusta TaxID=6412 RepID=T1EYW6_HELRO|nr:hypothetical protein HELRODRAFT_167018 [Helobdella robusta]ESO11923.1 hypothetical protein HELRODRAFT_167018 [Helobdella robusta]